MWAPGLERKRNDCNEKGGFSGSAPSILIICFLNKYYRSAMPDQQTAFQNIVLPTMQRFDTSLVKLVVCDMIRPGTVSVSSFHPAIFYFVRLGNKKRHLSLELLPTVYSDKDVVSWYDNLSEFFTRLSFSPLRFLSSPAHSLD